MHGWELEQLWKGTHRETCCQLSSKIWRRRILRRIHRYTRSSFLSNTVGSQYILWCLQRPYSFRLGSYVSKMLRYDFLSLFCGHSFNLWMTKRSTQHENQRFPKSNENTCFICIVMRKFLLTTEPICFTPIIYSWRFYRWVGSKAPLRWILLILIMLMTFCIWLYVGEVPFHALQISLQKVKVDCFRIPILLECVRWWWSIRWSI